MSNDRPDDDADDEYWQRVHEADDVRKPAKHEDTNVKTDPDEVRGWAEERGAVPVTDPNASGPGAYALRHENVVDGSAHERVSWDDFAAAFRGEDMAFHHADESDEAGTHRFVNRSDVDEHMNAEGVTSEPDTVTDDTDADRGVTGTAEDEGRRNEGRTDDSHAGEAQPDIGASETDVDTGTRTDADTQTRTDADTETRTDADTETRTDPDIGTDRDADEGTVVGDREGGVESGANAGTGRTETTDDDARRGETGTDTRTTPDALADVSEGDSVIDAEGETVGIVTAVEGGQIYVDPDPGLTEKLSAKLGWVDEDDAEYTVDADDVTSVENGDVRLAPVTL